MAPVILRITPIADLYRDTILDPGELFCTPEPPSPPPDKTQENASKATPQWQSPLGRYDAAEFLRTLPTPWREPSLVMVFYDVHRNSVPVNLAQVKCPKVLSIGDTHHLNVPLQAAIEYAKSEPFDFW